MGNLTLVATNSAQIPYAMMSLLHPLTSALTHPPHWFHWAVASIKILFFGIIFLLGWQIASALFAIAKQTFVQAILDLAKKLEPQTIDETRTKLTTELEEIQKHIEKTKDDSFRIQCENTWLRDKVNGLEKARKALIEELSGSPFDNTYIEFELWQQLTTVINILVADRMRLMSLLDVAISSAGASEDAIAINQENLLKQVHTLKEGHQKAKREITSLKTVATRLKNQNKKLETERLDDQRKTERLANEVARVERVKQELKTTKENSDSKNTEIKALRNKIAKLEKVRDDLTHELQDLEQHYPFVKRQVEDLTQRLREQESCNQRIASENGNLSTKLETLTAQLKTPDEYYLPEVSDSDLYITDSVNLNSRSNLVASAEFCLHEHYNSLYDALDRQAYISDHQYDRNNGWDI